jgi:uncharacterized protein (TIGR01370 family)
MSETGSGMGPEWETASASGILRETTADSTENRYVDVTSPQWKQLMIDRAVSVAKSGADGMFLDKMDGWSRVGGDSEANQAAMKSTVEAMAASARAINPNFKIVGNNDAELAADDPAYSAVCDGHMREAAAATEADRLENEKGKPIFMEPFQGGVRSRFGRYLFEEESGAEYSQVSAV